LIFFLLSYISYIVQSYILDKIVIIF